MRQVNLQTWPRREHFNLFHSFDYPHFNLCANVDLTTFYPFIQKREISFNIVVIYLLARVANTIPEFRYRIRGEDVVEHEIVHPSSTILTDSDLFSFCTIEYIEDFSSFAPKAAEQIAYVKKNPTLKDEPGQDNLLYLTAIPWVSFTSFMHPINLNPVDSVPRLAWGKAFEDHDGLKMPLSVQGHHALMDGVHMGRYFEKIQHYLNYPTSFLANE